MFSVLFSHTKFAIHNLDTVHHDIYDYASGRNYTMIRLMMVHVVGSLSHNSAAGKHNMLEKTR